MSDPEFERLFDDVYVRACAVGRRILGNAEEAEDVAAEALARAYARWPRVRKLPYADAWVLRVAINVALKRATRRTAEIPMPDPVTIDDVVAVRVTLVQAMNRLSRRQREAIGLRYLAGFSEDEVARSMGISTGSVKQHVSRGLAALRGSLGGDAGAREGIG